MESARVNERSRMGLPKPEAPIIWYGVSGPISTQLPSEYTRKRRCEESSAICPPISENRLEVEFGALQGRAILRRHPSHLRGVEVDHLIQAATRRVSRAKASSKYSSTLSRKSADRSSLQRTQNPALVGGLFGDQVFVTAIRRVSAIAIRPCSTVIPRQKVMVRFGSPAGTRPRIHSSIVYRALWKYGLCQWRQP